MSGARPKKGGQKGKGRLSDKEDNDSSKGSDSKAEERGPSFGKKVGNIMINRHAGIESSEDTIYDFVWKLEVEACLIFNCIRPT